MLELGSGLGLFGFSQILQGNVKEFIFSDCHEKVLHFLRINAFINLTKNDFSTDFLQKMLKDPSNFEESEYLEKSGVKIEKLDWTNFEVRKCLILQGDS